MAPAQIADDCRATADGARTQTTATRVAAFDGLRALAVVAVLCFHGQIPGSRGGFLGVSAFFTLSGFLITSLLLEEHARTGTISLRSFWARRARRLLPAAYLALAAIVVFGATIASVDQLRALRGDVLSALLYVANWHFLFAGRSYAALFSAPSPVEHFWSLAIEEQFYVVFPLLAIALLRAGRGRRRLLGVALSAGIAASVAASCALYASSGSSRVYYGTDTRAAELLVGALLAVVLAAPAGARFSARLGSAGAAALGCSALGGMLFLWVTVDQQNPWLYRGGFAVHALLTALVIVAARVDGPFARALGRRPLALLGLISYGVYLFHWPVFLWLSPERTGLATAPLFALRIGVTLAVAVASYLLLERRIRAGASFGVGRRVVAPVGAFTAAALVLSLLAVTRTPPRPAIVLSALNSTPPRAGAQIAPSGSRRSAVPVAMPPPTPRTTVMYRRPTTVRPVRILVVGDSVGLTLGRGLELWARRQGNAIVDNAARKFCPLGRYLPAQQGERQNYDMHYCDWTTFWPEQVRDFDPDVVVVLFTVWEAAPRKLPGVGWRNPGDPALSRWQQSEYGAAADVLAARGAQLVWMNVPCTKEDTITPHDVYWTVDAHTIPALAASRPFVHPLDLNDRICPGDKFSDAIGPVADARPDGTHFSDAGALTVADWLMPIVLGQAPAPAYRTGPLGVGADRDHAR